MLVPPASLCCLQVSLVVLDSATFHFRQDFTDAAQRSRLMLSMAQQLAQVAEQRGVAVVMVNQVCTGVGLNECVRRPSCLQLSWVLGGNKFMSLAPDVFGAFVSHAPRSSHASQTPAVPQEQAPQPVLLAVAAAAPTVQGCWRLP
jgi:hypothetical protein